MKNSTTHIAVGFAGILAVAAWPLGVFAQQTGSGETSNSMDEKDTGAYGTGQQESDSGGEVQGREGTGSFGTGQQQGTPQEQGDPGLQSPPSEETGAFGGGQQGTTSGEQGVQSAPLQKVDRSFLNRTAQINAGELKLAQLAEEKAQNPQVRSFARSLVDQHQQVTDKVQQFASQHNVTNLPSTAASSQQREYQQLSQLSGKQFDKQFIDTIVKEHEKAINNFESIADSEIANQQLQMWAIKTLPELRTHLVEARNLRKQVAAPQPSGQESTDMQRGGSQESAVPDNGGMQQQPSGGYR